ncbi:hypothetical protein JTB14_019488 [Gonioctena quinquepunctata]|nr:hypothetical protein JTB14_019488 [Gonioctena quinquepunctata]
MEASSVVSTAERLIRRATNILERRETARLQNGQNLIENEVVVNEKMGGKLLLENDTLDTSLYGKEEDHRNCLDTVVEEVPLSSDRKIISESSRPDLILETCPTMETFSVVSTAERLIRRAKNIFEGRETARLQNGQNLIQNKVVVNEKMEGKLLLENDMLDTSLYGKKKDHRNCLDTIVEEDPVSSNRKVISEYSRHMFRPAFKKKPMAINYVQRSSNHEEKDVGTSSLQKYNSQNEDCRSLKVNRDYVFKPWRKINSKRILQKSLSIAGQYHGI